jgi:hypothetical protein
MCVKRMSDQDSLMIAVSRKRDFFYARTALTEFMLELIEAGRARLFNRA